LSRNYAIELSHLHLGRDGWEVIVHGRNAERGAEVVHAIEAGGGQARFVAANLSDVDEVRALVEQVGVVDVLVNNAGASWFGPSSDIDEGTYNDLFDGNVRRHRESQNSPDPRLRFHQLCAEPL